MSGAVSRLNKRLTSLMNMVSPDNGFNYYIHEISGLGFFLYADSETDCSMQVEDSLRGRFGTYPVALGKYPRDAERAVRSILKLR